MPAREPATDRTGRCTISSGRSVCPTQAKDAINVPIALGAFRDNNVKYNLTEHAFIQRAKGGNPEQAEQPQSVKLFPFV